MSFIAPDVRARRKVKRDRVKETMLEVDTVAMDILSCASELRALMKRQTLKKLSVGNPRLRSTKSLTRQGRNRR